MLIDKNTTRVAIVYFSKTDITGKLVQATLAAIESTGAQTFNHLIQGKEIHEGRFDNPQLFESLKTCDAIIFASPTYMGGVAAQFKAFADATSELWTKQEWAGKIAAGITSGTGLNGDQSSTLQYLITLANQHGMLWVGLDSAPGYTDHGVNRLGCQLGVTAQTIDTTVNEIDLATTQYLGRRVAHMANKLTDRQSTEHKPTDIN